MRDDSDDEKTLLQTSLKSKAQPKAFTLLRGNRLLDASRRPGKQQEIQNEGTTCQAAGNRS